MGHEWRRTWLLVAAVSYLAFVIYGSVVPLDFRPRPIAEAWQAFRDIRYMQLGIASRADWVANILLFVPLSFLWLGVAWPRSNSALRTLASAIVLACCAALSATIEFVQIYFPPRTVSLNDIVAEVLGAAIGIAAWWTVGPRFMAWFSRWFESRTPSGAAEQLLYTYLFILIGYNVLPLDLTISPVELFHKWREGKLHLLPFSAPFPSAAQRAYDLLSDVAIWIPAAFLWRVSTQHTLQAVMLRVVGAASVLELLQLFVYSRVTDVTDILTAAVGGAVGAQLGARLSARKVSATRRHSDHRSGALAALWFAGLIGIAAVLATVFWYPFDFRTDWSFVQERVAALRRAPFALYYFGTEFRAATEVLHKVGFFIPLGMWLALGTRAMRHRARLAPLLHAAAATVIISAAVGIEFGQLFLPAKHADLTDLLLEALGGFAGYFAVQLLRRTGPAAHSAGVRTRGG